MKNSVFHEVRPVVSVKPQNVSGDSTVNGAKVAREGYRDGALYVSVGDVTGSPSSFTVDTKVQVSTDDGSSWSDLGVSASQITSANSEARADLAGQLLEKGIDLRVVVTVAFTGGSSPALDVYAGLLLGGAEQEPVN